MDPSNASMRDFEQFRRLVQWLMHPRCNGNIKVNIGKGADPLAWSARLSGIR